MLCPSCGAENRKCATFCGECAAPLAAEWVCAACGRSNPAGRKFCDTCGSSLTETAPPTHTPTPAPSPALPASFAGGRYQVQRFLGEGGRKRVYLAHDARLDRDVAIAVIKTKGLDEAGLERVSREAKAMGRLGDHPHIVTAFDIGDEGGLPYIFSQYMARVSDRATSRHIVTREERSDDDAEDSRWPSRADSRMADPRSSPDGHHHRRRGSLVR